MCSVPDAHIAELLMKCGSTPDDNVFLEVETIQVTLIVILMPNGNTNSTNTDTDYFSLTPSH